jgi:acetyl-CoA carboxylase biotin carboxyl carrier protein
MAIDQDDVIRIIKIMDESDYDELHLEMGDLKLSIAKSGTGGLSSIKTPESLSSMEPKHPATTSPAVADQALPPSAESTAIGVASRPEAPGIAVTDGLIPIKSPLLGSFYRGSKPGAPPFVEIGGRVTKEDTVCLIEVMKTFTTIKAGVEGRIVKICAENAEMVEYQQTLFLIEPEQSRGK